MRVGENDGHTGFLARLGRVRILLRHVFYVSYLLPVKVVAPDVPPALPLAAVDGDRVFVSLVALRNTMIGLGPLPCPHLTYNQVNLRTYAKDPQTGRQAVYFLRSGVTSGLVSLAARTIGIPWQRIECDIDVGGGGRQPVSFKASGRWKGDFLVEGETPPGQTISIPPFNDAGSALDYLVRPLIGFTGDAAHLRRFAISHPDVQPIAGQLKRIVFPMMLSTGLVDGERLNKPDSVLYVPQAQFSIYLPARHLPS